MPYSKKNIYMKSFILFIVWVFAIIGAKNYLITVKQNNCENCISWRKEHEIKYSNGINICTNVVWNCEHCGALRTCG